MVSKEGIREYFSRHLLGRLNIFSVPIGDHEVKSLSLKRKIDILGSLMKPRVVSPARFTLGKIVCISNGIKFGNFNVPVHGGRVEKYAPGEIKVKKPAFKFSIKQKKWKKGFISLPQERHNRLKFIPFSSRISRKGELNLAYFYPIIEDIVARLVLNKQDGTLFVWYNQNVRGFAPKGLYMYKRMGEKDVDWRWV